MHYVNLSSCSSSSNMQTTDACVITTFHCVTKRFIDKGGKRTRSQNEWSCNIHLDFEFWLYRYVKLTKTIMLLCQQWRYFLFISLWWQQCKYFLFISQWCHKWRWLLFISQWIEWREIRCNKHKHYKKHPFDFVNSSLPESIHKTWKFSGKSDSVSTTKHLPLDIYN